MRTGVILLTSVLGMGAASAAPAPVSDANAISGSDTDRLARIERILQAKQQTDFQTQQRLEALQQEVLDLRGLNEQQAYQIEQMLQRQRQLYDEIAQLSVKNTAAVVTPSTGVGQPTAGSTLSESGSYERAVNLVLKQRKYDEAIPAFKAFIAQYPNSTYAANANYWLGQLLFNKGDNSAAKNAFDTVVNQFPNSNKRGDSLVKLGIIAQKMGNAGEAKAKFQQVLDQYADSAAARIAQQEMAKL